MTRADQDGRSTWQSTLGEAGTVSGARIVLIHAIDEKKVILWEVWPRYFEVMLNYISYLIFPGGGHLPPKGRGNNMVNIL